MADHEEHTDEYGYTFKLTVKKEDSDEAWQAAKKGFEVYLENAGKEVSLFVWAGKIGPPPPPPPPQEP